uniref:Nucleolus and neural progenitor protein-like N-terminal domain-containing protein n=1 Tax=Leersia perrieri TaxID=77586 RepID=A0A0D9XFD4_9ORYZ
MATQQRQEGKGEEEERRLRGALRSLQQEAGVLERLVYKHRNQHRGAAYFQYLLKVRRDVRLLLAAGVWDVLAAIFPVLASRKPANTILAVNRQSKKKPGANHSHHERLLGVARLLSQMVEPVMKGAVGACFAGKSEGSGPTVYNKATDLIDRKQTVKISIGGAQAFREYYPSSNDARTFLECVWVKDKFLLHEKTKGNCEKAQAEDQKSCASGSAVLYETLVQVSEDMENAEGCSDMENAEGLNSPVKLPDVTLANQPETTHCHHDEDSRSRMQLVNDKGSDSLSDTLATHVHSIPCPDVKPETKKRVAFIAVGNPKVATSSIGTTLTKKQRLDVIPLATAEPEDLYGKFSEDTDKSIF